MLRFFTFTLCLLLSSSAYSSQLVPGKSAKMYKSSDGVDVTIVPAIDGPRKVFLVTVSGSDSKIDDLCMLHVSETEGSETSFYTFIDDEKFYSLVFAENSWGGKNATLSIPEAPTKKISIVYNDKASKKVDINAVIQKYGEQRKNGDLAKIELNQEENWKGRINGIFRRSVDAAKSYCGKGISSKIDWDSVDSKLHKKIPLATMCRRVADSLAQICRDHPEKNLSAKVSGIVCVVAKSQELSQGSDKQLVWKVPASGTIDLDSLDKKLKSMFN